MDRRQYLAVVGAGVTGGIAGAYRLVDGGGPPADQTSGDATPGRNRQTPTSTPEGTEGPSQGSPPVPTDVDLPVPESALDRAAPRDAIPAIVDPVFDTDWAAADHEIATETHPEPSLADTEQVIGLTRGGSARAYPLKLLRRHEVVNDTLDVPLLISYCPICKSGLVGHRRVDDSVRTFGVSGYLFSANLVLYDQQTDTLWSQLLAQAIRGPDTGTLLTLTVSTITTWAAWRREHPETTVLLPPPASGTVVGDVSLNYDLDPYGDHETVAERYPEYGPLGDLDWADTRLQRRTPVLGIAHEEEAVAYPDRVVRADGPIHDTVGGRPVVVTMAAGDTLVAYDRRVDGESLEFESGGDGLLRAGGSRWQPLDGVAVDGPYEGRQLQSVTAVGQLYWAAWVKFYPETTVYQ